MIIKWKAVLFGAAEIVRVDCIRETTHIVVCREDNSEWSARKISEGAAYFDSWAEAHAHLTQHAVNRVMGARRQLEVASSYAGNVKGMRAPVEAPT